MNTKELSSNLRLVISALHKGLRRQVTSTSSYSMTELETIGHLLRNPAMQPTELAVLARVKTQSMSQILKNLEEQKVIKRTPSKDDKRKVYISLTVTGRNLVEKARYDKDEWLKSAIETLLTEKDRDLLVKTIPVLNKIIAV